MVTFEQGQNLLELELALRSERPNVEESDEYSMSSDAVIFDILDILNISVLAFVFASLLAVAVDGIN